MIPCCPYREEFPKRQEWRLHIARNINRYKADNNCDNVEDPIGFLIDTACSAVFVTADTGRKELALQEETGQRNKHKQHCQHRNAVKHFAPDKDNVARIKRFRSRIGKFAAVVTERLFKILNKIRSRFTREEVSRMSFRIGHENSCGPVTYRIGKSCVPGNIHIINIAKSRALFTVIIYRIPDPLIKRGVGIVRLHCGFI